MDAALVEQMLDRLQVQSLPRLRQQGKRAAVESDLY
jgi:hypothetical protein